MSARKTRKTKKRQIASDIVSLPKRICGVGNIEAQQVVCTNGSLNDFRLLQIFNRLDIKDLFKVTDMNHQFKRVSKMSFAGRRATWNLQNYLDASSNAERRRVLCKFGDSIKSMCWVESFLSLSRLNEISRFCAGTVRALDVRTRTLNCDDFRPLFSSLETLTIDCWSFFGDVGRLFSGCKELKILRLTRVPWTGSTHFPEVAQKFGKLEELHIGERIGYNVRTTIVLLEMNLHIKKLDMFDDDANRTIYAFAPKLGGLEVLVLRHKLERRNYENVTELAGLKSLKVLEFHGVGPDFVAAIEAMESVPIERFKWDDCPADLQFLNRIGKWKSLKSLALPGVSLPLGGSLTELIEQLPLLHELELGFKNRNEPVRCIIGLVERFPKLNALAIHTDHPELFSQHFYDALLEVILKRLCSSGSKSFKVLIYCRRGVMHRLQMHRQLQVIFLGCENDSLSHYVRFKLDKHRLGYSFDR